MNLSPPQAQSRLRAGHPAAGDGEGRKKRSRYDLAEEKRRSTGMVDMGARCERKIGLHSRPQLRRMSVSPAAEGIVAMDMGGNEKNEGPICGKSDRGQSRSK
jgi:hypothetical protein